MGAALRTPAFRGAARRSLIFTRGARLVLAALCVGGLSGCALPSWFGPSETKLEGERIALRAAARSEARAGGVATFAPARSVREWPQAGGASNRSLGHADGAIQLERVWSTSIGAGSDSESRITASPVASAGRIYALDAAATVTAVSEKDGDEIWSAELAPENEDARDGFGGGLAAAGATLVATTGFGEAIGLKAATGEEIWRVALGSPVRSAPTVSQGVAVILARDGSVTALSVETGAQLWRAIGLEGGAAMLSGGGASPAISGEVVAAPFSSGDIGVFRLRDGRRGWSQPLGAARRGSAMSLIADVSSPPVIYEGRIIAGGVSGRLVAFDVPSGRRVWARDLGSYNPVWAAGKTLFVVSEDARVVALDAGTGLVIWETTLPQFDDPEDREGPIAYGGPILVGGKLFLVSSDEMVFRLDAATGAIELEKDLPGPATNPPISLNGRLIVLDDDGDLHAYQ